MGGYGSKQHRLASYNAMYAKKRTDSFESMHGVPAYPEHHNVKVLHAVATGNVAMLDELSVLDRSLKVNWQPDSGFCSLCWKETLFSMRGRHHCRSCGVFCCTDCVSETRPYVCKVCRSYDGRMGGVNVRDLYEVQWPVEGGLRKKGQVVFCTLLDYAIAVGHLPVVQWIVREIQRMPERCWEKNKEVRRPNFSSYRIGDRVEYMQRFKISEIPSSCILAIICGRSDIAEFLSSQGVRVQDDNALHWESFQSLPDYRGKLFVLRGIEDEKERARWLSKSVPAVAHDSEAVTKMIEYMEHHKITLDFDDSDVPGRGFLELPRAMQNWAMSKGFRQGVNLNDVLLFAIESCDEELLHILLDFHSPDGKPLQVNYNYKYEFFESDGRKNVYTLLHLAAIVDLPWVVEILLQRGASLNARDHRRGQRPCDVVTSVEISDIFERYSRQGRAEFCKQTIRIECGECKASGGLFSSCRQCNGTGEVTVAE